MKNLFIAFAVFSMALIIIGCQENFLNEPSETLLKTSDNLVSSITVKFNYDVRDPLYGISKLSGSVSYTHQIINRSMSPSGVKEIDLHIYMKSELDDMLGMMHKEWKIEGRSDDNVYVSEEGILLIEKSYWITNRTDVVLLVQYLVTTNGVGISSVSLVPLEK